MRLVVRLYITSQITVLVARARLVAVIRFLTRSGGQA